ncbi:MAG: outer membrane beta-barrel protein, partial [Planctomycetia bacterium]|nr:outer membrane beta-barrel protein [Planctomycetia bacterium]
AQGNGDGHGVGIVGLHIGREFSGRWLGDSGWALLPAAEFEGFYFAGTANATVSDPANRLNGHVFDTSYPMDNGAFLTNVVVSLYNPSAILSPYVGLGVGAANISIGGADSLQVVPPEPGVNHFNSDTSSSAWGFAFQFKVGARIPLGERAYVFAEYRYLFVSSTTQTFGSTVAPGHVPTTPWTVHFGDMNNHLAVGGIGFSF